MKHIHHMISKRGDEHYYSVVTYTLYDKKIVTISDLSLHKIINDIIQKNVVKELNQDDINLAFEILMLDKVVDRDTLLYNL